MVERSEIVKGYEFRKDEYVVIEPEEIKKIEPKTAKTMEILEFVKSSDVDPIYFESSYYMLPEEAGRRPYALLTKALEESEYVAIAKLTMHNREYTVFLRPHEGGMMLHTMYYAEEVQKIGRLWRARCRTERRGSQSRAPVDRGSGRRVGPGKISRHFPGKREEADRDPTRRRGSHRSREAEKAGPGRRPDGCAQTKPGPVAQEATATRRRCPARVRGQGGGESQEEFAEEIGRLRQRAAAQPPILSSFNWRCGATSIHRCDSVCPGYATSEAASRCRKPA